MFSAILLHTNLSLNRLKPPNTDFILKRNLTQVQGNCNKVWMVCDDSSKGSPLDLSIGGLKEMKQIYQNVVSEYQSLLTLYAIEKERARKKGKLSMFPKAFSQWQPEGSKYSESQLNAIIGGPQSKATIFEQYSVETKQRSHSYLYISKEHHNKMPSVVCCSLPCSGASQTSQEMKFGVIERLY